MFCKCGSIIRIPKHETAVCRTCGRRTRVMHEEVVFEKVYCEQVDSPREEPAPAQTIGQQPPRSGRQRYASLPSAADPIHRPEGPARPTPGCSASPCPAPPARSSSAAPGIEWKMTPMAFEDARLTFKSIELINFMCHRHLLVEFKKILTCIGGRNGSGKSAVMIALGIVLGQRANSLERGNTYKELIKNNEHTAVVRLCLHNYLNFHEDFFGDSIHIEKTLHVNFSKLRIQNSDGKVWSRRSQDLEDIIDMYSLYFDNPLNFLTQDMSKKFLNMSKPQMLYSFFHKGTEIENMEMLHSEACEQVERMRIRMEGIEEEVGALERELAEKSERLKYLGEVADFKQRLKELEGERRWSEVMEIGKRVARIEEEVSELEGAQRDKKASMQEIDAEIRALEEAMRAERDAYLAEKSESESARRAIEGRITGLELRDREMCNDMKGIEEQLAAKQAVLADYCKARPEGSSKDELGARAEKLRAQIATLSRERDACRAEEERLRERVRKEAEDAETMNSKIFALRKQISFLENVKTNSLTFFSERMPEILSEIKRENLDAIGPIGTLIQLKEPKWYRPVSIILRNNLSNFVVRSREDRERLSAIFRKHGVNFRILLPSSNQRGLIEYRSNRIFKTVLDVLHIRNDIVANQLIILQNIEQIILVESRESAHKIIRKRPSYVAMAYTPSGDRISLVGNALSDFRQRYSGKYYFENDDSKLEACREELQRLSGTSVGSSRHELRDAEARSYKLSRDVNGLEREVRHIEFELESHARVGEAASTGDLENEIQMLKNQRAGLAKAVEETRRAMEEERARLAELQSADIDLSRMAEAAGRLRAKRYAVETSLESLQPRIYEKIKERNEAAERFESEREKLRCTLGVEAGDSARDLAVIEKEIGALQCKIIASREVGSEAVLRDEIEHLKRQRTFKSSLVLRYKGKIESFVEFVRKRVERRESMKAEVAGRASEEFCTLTQYRGYSGSLLFDHDGRSLDIRMGVENMDAGSRGTLSGGERSFAGVCFLLSLWPHVGCPVKVLDEFDVFMDNLNRKLTIKIILDFLARNEYQVILITPLNTKDLFTDICDVVVLEKPRED
ncbi:UNVERIFIED_CONTAM: hypothetical protein PYX00_010898 [Menopon gallinae]|uniref:Structural maintenance of chromosomes protein 6 n=1 Tax=Menopon gallinae TaxID=328185 RepID=A0AAW2H6L9_9NEOP